jgi:hypothetical protein
MDERSNLKPVSAKLSLSENYLVGRMLMLREKLSVQQWHVYDRSAEAIWGSKPKPSKFLESLPINGLAQPDVRQQGFRVDRVLVAAKRVVPEQVDVLPRHRGDLLELRELKVPSAKRWTRSGLIGAAVQFHWDRCRGGANRLVIPHRPKRSLRPGERRYAEFPPIGPWR